MESPLVSSSFSPFPIPHIVTICILFKVLSGLLEATDLRILQMLYFDHLSLCQVIPFSRGEFPQLLLLHIICSFKEQLSINFLTWHTPRRVTFHQSANHGLVTLQYGDPTTILEFIYYTFPLTFSALVTDTYYYSLNIKQST